MGGALLVNNQGLAKAESYRHEEEALLRPDVGTQAQFRKRKPPKNPDERIPSSAWPWPASA